MTTSNHRDNAELFANLSPIGDTTFCLIKPRVSPFPLTPPQIAVGKERQESIPGSPTRFRAKL